MSELVNDKEYSLSEVRDLERLYQIHLKKCERLPFKYEYDLDINRPVYDLCDRLRVVYKDEMLSIDKIYISDLEKDVRDFSMLSGTLGNITYIEDIDKYAMVVFKYSKLIYSNMLKGYRVYKLGEDIKKK